MGGCVSIKADPDDTNPNVYHVANLSETGDIICDGEMSINRAELTFVCPNREPMHWPLNGIRRYGCDPNMFTFEAGRRCQSPEGVYAFGCTRAEQLFLTLQMYIQNPAHSVYTEPLIRPDNAMPANNGPARPLVRLPGAQQSNAIAAGGTAGTVPMAQLANPGDGGQQQHHQYTEHQVPQRPTDAGGPPNAVHNNPSGSTRQLRGECPTSTLVHEVKYLFAVSKAAQRLSSANSGNGIGSVTPPTANGIPAPAAGGPAAGDPFGNLYHEFRNNGASAAALGPRLSFAGGSQQLSERNNNTSTSSSVLDNKKRSLDVPPAELAPSPGHMDQELLTPTSPGSVFYHNTELGATYINAAAHMLPPYDADRAYMNVLLGDESTADAPVPQSPAIGLVPFSPLSAVGDGRTYENLDLPVLRRTRPSPPPLLLAEPPSPTNGEAAAAGLDSSDSCSPSMLYIELDLDQPTNFGDYPPVDSPPPPVAATKKAIHLPQPTTTTKICSTSPVAFVVPPRIVPLISKPTGAFMTAVPDSPTKYANVNADPDDLMDYAKIDFNKTMALSNSTTPSTELDSEESRRTRHSSAAFGFGET